jgi:hypothetical protein
LSFTSLTVGTMRQTSTVVSAEGRFVAASISLKLAGSVKPTRTRPFSRKLRKSRAFSPLTRKSSASTGRNSGSSAAGFRLRRFCSSLNRASALAGDSWNWSFGM